MILMAVKVGEGFYFLAPGASWAFPGEWDELDSPSASAFLPASPLKRGERREGNRDATGLLPWSLRQTLSW